jgi:hypothetical protein
MHDLDFLFWNIFYVAGGLGFMRLKFWSAGAATALKRNFTTTHARTRFFPPRLHEAQVLVSRGGDQSSRTPRRSAAGFSLSGLDILVEK